MRVKFQYMEEIDIIEDKITIHGEKFEMPVTTAQLRQLQDEDEFCSKLMEQLNKGTLQR